MFDFPVKSSLKIETFFQRNGMSEKATIPQHLHLTSSYLLDVLEWVNCLDLPEENHMSYLCLMN